MSRRIDIELTSALGDGTWTWRAAGARQPKGVVDGSVLPSDAKVGDELKVEVEQEIDGITVLGIVQAREKPAPAVVELLPVERDFKPVVETRAKRDRNDRGGRGGRDGDRRPRRDRDDRGKRDGRGSGGGAGQGRGDRRPDGHGRDDGGRGDGRRDGNRGRRGPSFTPPPEVPQRPKPKRLRPGKAHRNTVLAELPEEQRAVAELALQGMGAVRQRVREENEKATAEGRPAMPEATVMKMAEELLPKLRLAEWLDRAEAAQRQMEHLDLRDLRSVVAASGDPTVARDERGVQVVAELKQALVHKQEQELLLWFGDVDAALAVGRVIRALRLSSQPPKAGVPFPVDIAQRLADSVNASLAPMDSPERWSAMLEAAAFSPVRLLIKPIRKPDVVNDELLATVKRLAPALPQIAEMFEIEVNPKAPMPKPLRPNQRSRKDGGSGGRDSTRKDTGGKGKDRKPRAAKPSKPIPPVPEPPATAESAEAESAEAPPSDAVAPEPVSVETTGTDTPEGDPDIQPVAPDASAAEPDPVPATVPVEAAVAAEPDPVPATVPVEAAVAAEPDPVPATVPVEAAVAAEPDPVPATVPVEPAVAAEPDPVPATAPVEAAVAAEPDPVPATAPVEAAVAAEPDPVPATVPVEAAVAAEPAEPEPTPRESAIEPESEPDAALVESVADAATEPKPGDATAHG